MGSLAKMLWKCAECKGYWRMTRGESLNAGGSKCPLCGSMFTDVARNTTTHAAIESLVGHSVNAEKHSDAGLTGVGQDEKTTGYGKHGCERNLVKAAKRTSRLSYPNPYRRGMIRNGHAQYLARKAKAEKAANAIVFYPPRNK